MFDIYITMGPWFAGLTSSILIRLFALHTLINVDLTVIYVISVTEGLALHRGGISPYSGDMFHEVPLSVLLSVLLSIIPT